MDGLMLTSARRRVELEQKHFPKGTPADAIKLLDDVQELLSRAYQAGRQAAERIVPQEWSNQSSCGYAIYAAERIGKSDEEIHRLVRAIHRAHDTLILEEAAEIYRRSNY